MPKLILNPAISQTYLGWWTNMNRNRLVLESFALDDGQALEDHFGFPPDKKGSRLMHRQGAGRGWKVQRDSQYHPVMR